MYVCIYIYIHTHTHTHTYISRWVKSSFQILYYIMCVCVCVCVCVCIYIYIHIQVSEELISNSLYTAPYSQVDLLVRTSGSPFPLSASLRSRRLHMYLKGHSYKRYIECFRYNFCSDCLFKSMRLGVHLNRHSEACTMHFFGISGS